MMKQAQRLGSALMQAVAVMPVAALLMGIGYALDPQGWGAAGILPTIFIQAGAAVLDHLGVIFAIAVAYGLSKDKNGAAALSGWLGFKVIMHLLTVGNVAIYKGLDKDAAAELVAKSKEIGWAAINDKNVLIGILVGILAAVLYNRFHDTKLPVALAFFGGRRLVPILTAFASIALAGVLFFVWPVVYSALFKFGSSIVDLGAWGAGIYGFFNRLLIPTGLHHALNNVFWFDTIGINDIGNFWAQTGEKGVVGMYQAGFFPIMMFGLAGAALAMYKTAYTKHKKTVLSLMIGGVLASFLTGVTEPIEFSFMFVAPLLYVVHALLTAVSLFVAASLHWIAGFGFSAGLIDLVLSSFNPYAVNWFMLIPLGIVFFVLYFFIFYALIRWLNLKTPGREDDTIEEETKLLLANDDFTGVAEAILKAVGGKENVTSVDNCTTRLRLEVKNHEPVSEKAIKAAGAAGVIRPSRTTVQVVIGPQVEFVAEEFKKLVK